MYNMTCNVLNECFKEHAHQINGHVRNILVIQNYSDIKVDDRVILSLSSYYNDETKKNPTDCVGTVKEISHGQVPTPVIEVEWDNGQENNYYKSDLIVVPKDFLKQPDLKVCTCCKEEKNVAEFKESENSEDGYFPMCNWCVAVKEVIHKENYERYFSK